MKALFARIGVVLLIAAAPVGVYLLPAHDKVSYPEAWDPRVLPLVEFVQEQRGLTFKHPVTVSFLAEEEFVAKVKHDETPTKDELAEQERFVATLRALGLVAGEVDLQAAVDDLLAAGVVGLYVSEDKALYVRGTELTPFVRSTVAHELTHALQDQHFGLEALLEAAPGGDDTAVRGLIEGDAVRIEESYQAALSPADRQAFDTESRTAVGRTETVDVPAVLKHLQELPYVLGTGLIDVLLQQGGNAGVDRAFGKPPVSEIQLADPINFEPSWRPEKVADPVVPAGSQHVEKALPFGQVSLFQVLGAKLGYTSAWDAVQGWRGDSYRTYEQDGATCVQVDVRTADAKSAKTLADATARWTDARSRAEWSQQGETVTVRACDPGVAALVPAVTPDAFEVLAARAQLMHYLTQGQRVPPAVSLCLADGVLRRLGVPAFAKASAGQGTQADEQKVSAAFQGAVQTCQA